MNNRVINCDELDKDEKIKLAIKLNIDEDKIKNSKNLCNLIKNRYNKNFPCDNIIKEDTKLKIKSHQLSVANKMVNTRGVVVLHDVGTFKTLTAILTSRCLLLSNIIKNCIIVTPTSLQENAKIEMMKYNYLNLML